MAWIWFSLLMISLGVNMALALMLAALRFDSVAPAASAVWTWLRSFTKKAGVLLIASTIAILSGCDESSLTPKVQRLQPPPAEVPVCNLPRPLRQRNWPSTNPETRGQGSCVFASTINLAQWHNEPELAAWIRKNPEWQGGEYATRLMEKLTESGIEFKANIHADPRFLDWCTKNRRGCIFWWKPNHCCTFLGFARDPRDGKEYGYILDNNYPERIERCEREQLIRLWAGYGGFALTLSATEPCGAMPWKSYEVIE